MTLITQLKNINLIALNSSDDLDEAIWMVTQARAMRAGYEREQVESPEYLDNAIRTLERYIADKKLGRLELRRMRLRQEIDGNRSREERRRDAEAELAKIEAQISGKQPTSVG